MEESIFKVGDDVFDVGCGWGKVVVVEPGHAFPVTVEFEGYEIAYTQDGKQFRQGKRTLFFGEPVIAESILTKKRLPDIPIDTKVMVRLSPGVWINRYFHSFEKNGDIVVFRGGTDSWSCMTLFGEITETHATWKLSDDSQIVNVKCQKCGRDLAVEKFTCGKCSQDENCLYDKNGSRVVIPASLGLLHEACL